MAMDRHGMAFFMSVDDLPRSHEADRRSDGSLGSSRVFPDCNLDMTWPLAPNVLGLQGSLSRKAKFGIARAAIRRRCIFWS
jgi:hypothetical protein